MRTDRKGQWHVAGEALGYRKGILRNAAFPSPLDYERVRKKKHLALFT
jgi:hypothetical protein